MTADQLRAQLSEAAVAWRLSTGWPPAPEVDKLVSAALARVRSDRGLGPNDDELSPFSEEDIVELTAKTMLTAQTDASKESWGWWATWVWVLSGIYFYSSSSTHSVLSMSALLFIVAGMFASALIFGALFQGLQRGAVLVISKTVPRRTFDQYRGAVGLVGWLLLAGQIVVTFCVARWVFLQFA